MAEGRLGAGTWRWVLAFGLVLAAWLAWSPAQVKPSFNHLDKLQHLLAFAALGLASIQSFPRHRRAAMLAMLAFGVLIELVQVGLPTRSADGLDVVADALGIGLGCLISLCWQSVQKTAN